MVHHETAILNDFDSCFCECFGCGIVANSGLQPYRLRHFCQNIFNVRRNFLRSAKNVYEIDIDWNVDESPVHLLPEYPRRVWIVNRHRNNLKARAL